MRTTAEHLQRWQSLQRIKYLGAEIAFTTRGGKRHHTAIIAAVLETSDPMNDGKGRWHWLSDEERQRFENTPKRMRYMLGGVTIVRIADSKHAGSVGCYICR